MEKKSLVNVILKIKEDTYVQRATVKKIVISFKKLI